MQKNEKTNNDLYLERTDLCHDEYGQKIMSYDAFRKANERNGEYWQMMYNPRDQRFPMVKFEDMRTSFKDKINAFYGGNVYDYFARQPIERLFVPDPKAEQWYMEYRYANNLTLPPDVQQRYRRAAEVLNGCIKAIETKRFIKDELGLKHVDSFWNHVLDIIKAKNICLPSSYGNLVSKPDSAIKQYKEFSYASLIHKNYGNKSAAKIGKTEDGYSIERENQQVAIIRKIARLHMNLDNVQIADTANAFFEKNNWETISPATVANLVAKHMPNVIAGKRGQKVYNNTVSMQVSRQRPQFPSYYWTMDGWTVELLYKDGSKYDNRLTIVVVLDVMNNYPVGYAIGDRENTDLIRMALRNAIIHMQDMFGATYRPWQLQSDRYGLKNLTPFYESVSHLYTPAAVGNAKSKVIEPYFNYINKTYCQKHFNWSGFNITSRKDHQPNIEKINEIKKALPDKAGLIDQINSFMTRERMSKVEDYKKQWDLMPLEDQVTLSPEDCLVVFGKAHTELNSITGLGLITTINGTKKIFDSFDPAFRALQFVTRFQVIYDPEDFSQALAITEDGKQRFMVHNKMKVGMGFKNTTPEQLEYHAKINAFNKERKEEIIQTYLTDDSIVAELLDSTPLNLNNDQEAALKLMLTDKYGQQKEGIQDAKGLKQLPAATTSKAATEAQDELWQHQQQQYLQSKTNINEFL